jgi:AraC-like DNA-binding protein
MPGPLCSARTHTVVPRVACSVMFAADHQSLDAAHADERNPLDAKLIVDDTRMRVDGVRETLLHARTQERSISEIALDHGFWHLSQFAVDYRKFFDETPTTTRRRVLRGSAH